MLSAGQYTQSKRWRKSTCDSCAGAKQTDEGRTASSGTTLQLFHPKALPSRLARLTPSRTERETRGAERSPRSGRCPAQRWLPAAGRGRPGSGRRSGRGGARGGAGAEQRGAECGPGRREYRALWESWFGSCSCSLCYLVGNAPITPPHTHTGVLN